MATLLLGRQQNIGPCQRTKERRVFQLVQSQSKAKVPRRGPLDFIGSRGGLGDLAIAIGGVWEKSWGPWRSLELIGRHKVFRDI